MSLFVAIRPDESAADDLDHALDRVRRLPLASALRWQPASQWHVTLAFLGEPDDGIADDVAERLEGLASQAVVTGLRVTGAGCFGRQILWMGLGDEPAVTRLGDVVHAIPRLLRGAGVTLDRRPWRPHLTIARARTGDARPVADTLADYRGPAWEATEVLLVRSTGGPRPAHHVIATVPLAAGSAGAGTEEPMQP